MTVYTNSITPVSITIANGATTGTATISAVGANSFLVWQGHTQTKAAATPLSEVCRVTLTNSTTVTATRNTSDASNSIVVNAVVIDPTSNLVTGVQAGTITITAGTTNTATISSVNTSLSAVFYLGQSTTSATSYGSGLVNVALTNSTTVTATVALTGTCTVSYVVVTFASAAIQSIQQLVNNFTQQLVTTDVVAISAVTVANSIIAFGGQSFNTASTPAALEWISLTSTIAVTFTRQASGNGLSRLINCTVIEFKSGVLRSIQRGSIDLNSVASNTATISSVTTNDAFVQSENFAGSFASANSNEYWGKLALTNATTVTATKNTAGTTLLTMGYEVVEFNNSAAAVIAPGPMGMGFQFVGWNSGTIDPSMHKIEDGISA